MGQEINLLQNYPKAKRDLNERAAQKTEGNRAIARRFGKEFFDGERSHGYGGFQYSPRFWRPVVPTVQQFYSLQSGHSLLDVGCAKGFMLHDFAALIPGLIVKGIDVSSYAIANAIEDMQPYLQVADARELPFPDKSFDLVISINTIHNLAKEECAQALREIERVSRGKSYVMVDAYRNDAEQERMLAWNLTAKTIMHVDEWKGFFKGAEYTGDYYWFIP